MTRAAWNGPCPSVVEQALWQTFYLPRLLAYSPISDTYQISIARVSVSVILWLLSGFQLFIRGKWSVTNLTYSLYSTLSFISFLNLYVISMVHTLWKMRTVAKLQEMKIILNGVESTILRKGDQWHYTLKWYKLNWNLIFLIAVQSYATVRTWRHEEFMECAYDLASTIFVELGMATTLNQLRGILYTIGNLMSQIKFMDDSYAQVKLNERLLSAIDIVNELFGPQLFFITSGILFSSSGIIYLLCKDMFVSSSITPFLMMVRLITLLVQLIWATGGIKNEVDQMNEYFYKKLITRQRDEILEFHLTSKRDCTITASGFFDFKNTLVVSMITATTTYMVLLLQYSP